ncbi:60S ribosomal L8 [Schistosoma japonicum]|nr:60S ribosomal L8 [Schistosoma japonicum]
MLKKKDWLPKRICVPRKSVSTNHSSSWVKYFGPTNNLLPKRPSARTKSTLGIVLNTENREDQHCVNISPTSSPEETLAFGHELLSIDNLDEPTSLGNEFQIQNSISGNCSSSVSSQNENVLICEHSQPSSEVAEVNVKECTNLDESDFDSLCYLTELQRDCSELPYAYLTVKSLPHRISSNSILRKLHHLVKRNSSERSIWLHQRSMENILDPSKHASKTFQILKIFRNYSSSLSGLVAFGVRDITTPTKNEMGSSNVNKNLLNTFAVILLPISGISVDTEGLFSFNSGNFILGDVLKCGDFVAVFGPWSTYSSREFSDFPVMHSFFWVERLKHDVLSGSNHDLPDFQIMTFKPELTNCPCLLSCDPSVVVNCSKRFKRLPEPRSSVLQNFQDSSENSLTGMFNKKCILVLGYYRFWLLKKLRYILLAWHFNGFPGLILLPNHLVHSGIFSNPVVSCQDFNPGNVYTAESLLQLPDNQLEDKIQKEVFNHINEIKWSLEQKYTNSFMHFIHGPTNQKIPIRDATSTEYSKQSIKLWEARASNFDLVESNYIHFNLSTPYKNDLAKCTRCSISGYLLLEPSDGSLAKDVISDWFNSEIKNLQCSSRHIVIFTCEHKFTRPFYIWVSEYAASTLLPCVCLVDCLSPIELIYEHLFSISSTPNYISAEFGVHLTVDQALACGNFILLDRFTLLKVEKYFQHPLPTQSLKYSLSKQIYTNSTLLQSLEDVSKMYVHQIVCFSGTITHVDTNRSHVWPICPYCACADFEIHSLDNTREVNSKQETLKCVRCAALLSNPLQRIELEVQVIIHFDQDLMSVNQSKRYKSSVEFTLNMTSSRLCKLLNVTQSNLLKESGLKSQDLINCHLDNVTAIVAYIPNIVFPVDSVQKYPTYLRNPYVIELDQIESIN